MLAEGEFLREVRRILPRLTLRGAHIRATGDGFGLFAARNQYRKPLVTLSGPVMRRLLSRDLLTAARPDAGAADAPEETIWRLSDVGAASLRRLAAGTGNVHAAQHRLMTPGVFAPCSDVAPEARVNAGESPIGWLRSRKGPNGEPLLSDAAWDAAERLREDFTLARLTPRVTTDWNRLADAKSRRRSGAAALNVGDAAFAARERVRKALDEVGPGLADALLQVCCHLKGLEQAERDLNWPRRSGKLVLSMALERLAAHYGFTGRERRGGGSEARGQ